MERCTLEEAAAKMYGKVKASSDPNFSDKFKTWGDQYHAEKGASVAFAERVAKADGRTIPGRLYGTADEHNPLLGRLTEKLNNKGKHAVFSFMTPEQSVAPRILAEMKGRYGDYKTYIDPAADSVKTYKAQVAKHAETLLNEINENPNAHGVTDGNRYPTTHFLELMKNGWPEFDFTAPEEGLQADYAAKGVMGKLMQSKVILNPMIYLFHAGELPLRVFSQYPNEGMAVLGKIAENPEILKGQPIPEALKAGVYTKLLPDSAEWGEKGSPEWRANMAKALTGIPLTQTVSESTAWLLHQEGVPLKEALQNVALSHNDPFSQQFMLTRPDHSNFAGFTRYSMLQNAWYLNLVKTAFKGGEVGQKALGALLMYSGMKAVLFGSKAAVPGASLLQVVPGFNQAAKDIDDATPLNLVKKATGLDIGEQMSPVQTWMMPFYPVKLFLDAVKANPQDGAAIKREFEKGQNEKGALTVLHLLLNDYNLTVAPFVKGAPVVPNEALKWIQAYAKTVDNASGNAAGKSFIDNLIGAHLGKEAQKEFATAHSGQ